MRNATPAFFCFPISWNIFFHPLTFSLYVSLDLKWVSCTQHIYGSCFCIHSASLCLLVGAFNPFTFKVMITLSVPITIFLIVLGLFVCFLIYFFLWLCWIFVSVRGLSLVVASGGHSSSQCAGLSLLRPLLLRSTGSRRAGSVIVAHGPSCSAACGIFPDHGSNLCPLHWQADSQPLRHWGSPFGFVFVGLFLLLCFLPRELSLAFVVKLVWWC